MVNGENVNIKESFVSVVDGNNSKLYMPTREILETLGYKIEWYNNINTINIINNDDFYQSMSDNKNEYFNNKETTNQIFNLKSNTFNMSESGQFYAKDNQTLKLEIDADLINGSVDFILFDPVGEEQNPINIVKMKDTVTVELTKGLWSYNCSGRFRGSGHCNIVGILE